MKTQFQRHLERIEVQASKDRHNAALNASNLKDVAQVHDHVKQLTEENRKLRREAETLAKKASLSQETMRKFLNQQSESKSEMVRLKVALQSCSTTKHALTTSLDGCNQRLHDLKRMENSLASELETAASEFSQAMTARDSQLIREKLRMKSKEDALHNKLSNLQLSKDASERNIVRLQKQKAATETALVDTVVHNAEQVQSLVTAERLGMKRDGPVATGRSNLLWK